MPEPMSNTNQEDGMDPKRPGGPKSELARYAYGWSDKKPSLTYWVIQTIVAVGAVASILGWWGRP